MTDSQALRILVDAAHAPADEWPDRYPDQSAMGYLCSYVPEEMIHASGFTPLRLRGTSAPLRHVDAHLLPRVAHGVLEEVPKRQSQVLRVTPHVHPGRTGHPDRLVLETVPLAHLPDAGHVSPRSRRASDPRDL